MERATLALNGVAAVIERIWAHTLLAIPEFHEGYDGFHVSLGEDF